MSKQSFPNHDPAPLLPTTIVGSYPQPSWLHAARDLTDEGRLSDAEFEEANDDAVKAVVGDLQRAGLDVVTDGEVRRLGMIKHFAQFVDGCAMDDDDEEILDQMPTAVDTVSTAKPWVVDEYEFAAAVADRPVKTTITGPYTFASFCSMDAYDTVEGLACDIADLIAEEVQRLVDAGATWIQLDEPALGMTPNTEVARACVSRIAPAVPDDVRFSLHVCSGEYDEMTPELFEFPVDEIDLEFASDDADDPHDVLDGIDLDVDIGFGVVNSKRDEVDSVSAIRERIEYGLEVIPPERMTVSTDCGMKPISRAVAEQKVRNMVTAAREVESALADT